MLSAVEKAKIKEIIDLSERDVDADWIRDFTRAIFGIDISRANPLLVMGACMVIRGLYGGEHEEGKRGMQFKTRGFDLLGES